MSKNTKIVSGILITIKLPISRNISTTIYLNLGYHNPVYSLHLFSQNCRKKVHSAESCKLRGLEWFHQQTSFGGNPRYHFPSEWRWRTVTVAHPDCRRSSQGVVKEELHCKRHRQMEIRAGLLIRDSLAAVTPLENKSAD